MPNVPPPGPSPQPQSPRSQASSIVAVPGAFFGDRAPDAACEPTVDRVCIVTDAPKPEANEWQAKAAFASIALQCARRKPDSLRGVFFRDDHLAPHRVMSATLAAPGVRFYDKTSAEVVSVPSSARCFAMQRARAAFFMFCPRNFVFCDLIDDAGF